MFYLVGVSVQNDSLVIFIKDDTDNSIVATTKADVKFALKNGITINGVSLVDGKENFEQTYLEKDVYLLNDTEKQAIQKICQLEQTSLEPVVVEYSHLQDNGTGELFTLSEGLRKLDEQRQVYGFSVESYNLTPEEKESIDKLSKLFGVGLNTSNADNNLIVNGLDNLEGLGDLSGLDTLDGETDEYGLSTEPQEQVEDTEEEHDHEEETAEEEENTVVSKLYAQLDDDQNAILRRYYLWYSQRVFELAGLKGKNTNIHQNTKRMKTKRDAIAKLKKTGGTWMYAGFIDAGREGKKCCEFGHIIPKDKDVCAEGHPVYLDARCEFKHPLRYMHIAWDVEKMDLEQAFFGNRYDKRIEQVLHDNKDTAIIFGIACIGDFFDIDPSYKNMLMATQRNTLKDMEQIYQYYDAGNVADVNASFAIMDDFMTYVKKNLAQSNLFGIPSVLDAGTTQFYLQCRNAGLIPPKSLVQMVRDSIIGWDINSARGHKFTGTLGYVKKDFFIKVMNTIFKAEFNDLLNLAYLENTYMLTSRSTNPSTIPTNYTDSSKHIQYLKYYFDIYFKYEICGEFYKYTATAESKDEGGTSEGVRRELYSIYRYVESCLWKDVEYSVDYLRKINNFYKVCASINLDDYVKTVYTYVLDGETNRYKIDFNNTRIDYKLLEEYSQENDSKLAEVIAKLSTTYRGTIDGLWSWKSYVSYHNYGIEELTALFEDLINTVKSEQTAYNTWVINRLTKICEDKNAIMDHEAERIKTEEEQKKREEEAKKLVTEQEKANRLAELKAKDAKKLSNAELVEVLKDSDTSSLADWQRSILNTAVNWRDVSKLSAKQVYQLQRMFNQLYHPDTPAQNDVTDLKDDPAMKEALEYALANRADFIGKKGIDSFGLDKIAVSVVQKGHYSPKQSKFIAPIKEYYEENFKGV